MIRRAIGVATVALAAILAVSATAQPPGGFGGPPGGPPGGEPRKLVAEFDTNRDGWLNAAERVPARAKAKEGGRPGRGGPPGGFGGRGPETSPGPKVSPADVRAFPDAPLYAPAVLRTLFLTFENADWEQELADFHGTDVEVPCDLTVDGKTYPRVGVHFRGMSSYFMVRAGQKRSFNLSLDLADKSQRLLGAKTLNLLNGHDDASLLSTVLYSHVARQYIPAPKADLVKVVVNGESWGVYTNVQQFDAAFLQENFQTTKGTRWKVRGSPGGGGGLDYLGDDIASYERRYEMKGKDNPAAWKALVKLCKTLSETPSDKLEAALVPMLDIDGLLKFLALDVALINVDGYWIRASDYSLYLDDKGQFHVVPHDMNEAFRPAQGPGMGGPGGGGPGGGGPGGRGGPMGGMMRFPRPGAILPDMVQDDLGLTAGQKKQLADLQAETDAKLAKLLTAEQAKKLKELADRGPGGFGGPPGMGGPGGPGGGAGGVTLDPLVGLDDARKPLRSKVLAVPKLKAQYLAHVRTIADKSLDWKVLGPVVADYRKLIEAEVAADTRKLDTTADFLKATAPDATKAQGRDWPLRAFADQRRAFLLGYSEKKGATR